MARRLLVVLLIGGTLFAVVLAALTRVPGPHGAAAPVRQSSAAKARPGNPWAAAAPAGMRNVTPATVAERADPWGPAAPPAPKHHDETRRFARVVVADSGHLQADKVAIRLYGISAPDPAQTCKSRNGDWPCGARATTALRSLVRARAVECEIKGESAQELVGLCRVGNTDLSDWLLRQGWADVDGEAESSYADAVDAARKSRLGLWSDGALRK